MGHCNGIVMPLQCPITLADTYRLKCVDLSGIRLPLITISKSNFSEIHISWSNALRFALSPIMPLEKVQFTKCSAWQSWTKTQMGVTISSFTVQQHVWSLVFLLSIGRKTIIRVYDSHFTMDVLLHFSFFSLALFYLMYALRAKQKRDCMLISLLNLIHSQGRKGGGQGFHVTGAW